MSLNESIVEDAGLEWFLLRSAPLNYGGPVGEQCRCPFYPSYPADDFPPSSLWCGRLVFP